MSDFVSVATTDDIPPGEGRSFEIEDRVIAIFNLQGKFYAIDDLCPHMGASLATGFLDPETCNVTCPWHGWRFKVTDGTWADNPRVKTDSFPIRVVGQSIQVCLQPARVSGVEDGKKSGGSS
jgi:nitrite reductase (NADH) small subunit/3-phenylpropionate/trans-cinnamate dioxygenase ferredoxin subunit